jgi:hypothetical protein
MELEAFADSAEASQKLLSWPEALSSFKLLGSFKNALYIDLPMVKNMLVQHRNSFVSLDIAHIPHDGKPMFVIFLNFPFWKSCLYHDGTLENPERNCQILSKYSRNAFRRHDLENLHGLSR